VHYDPEFDVRDLISLSEVMDEYDLGLMEPRFWLRIWLHLKPLIFMKSWTVFLAT